MKKYSKKVALILVLALILATAIPALAATKHTTEITGAYEAQEIAVLVPGSVNAVINPYRLPVKAYLDDGSVYAETELEKPGQIATNPIVGANLGKLNLSVGATVIGKPKGNFKFSTSAPTSSTTTNTGLVFLQVKAAGGLNDAYTVDRDASNAISKLDPAKVMAEINKWTPEETYSSKDTDKVLVGTKAASKTGFCTIEAGTAGEDGEIAAPSAKGYFVARLGGSVVQRPATDWSEEDGFGVSITWIFEPDTRSSTGT